MESVIEALETMLDGGIQDGMVFIYIPSAHAAPEEPEDKDEYEQTPALKKRGKTVYDQFHAEDIFAGGLSPGTGGSTLTVTQI